ncbi:hypothetical protein ACKFKG_09180 [Phormidesmis sp. 146-35]
MNEAEVISDPSFFDEALNQFNDFFEREVDAQSATDAEGNGAIPIEVGLQFFLSKQFD